MMKHTTQILAALTIILPAINRDDASAQSNDIASRMRPIGGPSAVDQYRPRESGSPQTPHQWSDRSAVSTTMSTTPVRQTAWMQSQPGMGFPGTMSLPTSPPNSVLTAPPMEAPVPTPSLPNTVPYPEASSSPQPVSPIQPETSRSLPPPPITASNPVPSMSDRTPIAAPQLDTGGYATVDNCNLVTGPSNYLAYADCGCGQVLPTGYNAPRTTQPPAVFVPGTVPTEIAGPATMPPPISPPVAGAPVAGAPIVGAPIVGTPVVGAPPPTIASPPPKAPPRALISFGQNQNPVQIGQGLWGQPVAYVPGQKCRNWVRYIFP